MQTKTYRYRPHVQKMPKIFGLFAIGFLGAMLLAMVVGDMWFLAPMGLFISAEFLVIAWLGRRLATTELTLDSEGFSFRNCARDVTIPYDEITRIDSGSIPYFGGWVRVHGRGEKLRMTVTLEGISDLVPELKWRTDAAGHGEAVYDRRRLFGFLKTAAYCEQSWARIQGFGRGAGIAWLFVIFTPLLLTSVVGAGVVVPFALGMIVWFGSEIILARHIAKNADDLRFTVPGRDREIEREALKSSAIYTAAFATPVALTAAFIFLL